MDDRVEENEAPDFVVKATNIHPHRSQIDRRQRNRRFGHQSGVLWLTGLSGSGKSTIATGVEHLLFKHGYLVSVLDGDTVRSGLNADLTFSQKDRYENLRRVAEVASLLANSGHIVLSTLISPHEEGREFVQKIVKHNFHAVYIKAKLEDCIKRDPKGLYQKALAGEIKNFTGLDQAYEEPAKPHLVVDTSENDIHRCQQQLADYIMERFGIDT